MKKRLRINWKALEKQNLDETINALSMASPFTLEEKQILLEAKNLDLRKIKLQKFLKLIVLIYTKIIQFNN